VISEAWEIIKTSIIIALSGFGGWLLTKLLKGYFKNVGETIEKQGILLDDIRNGKVKVMYQQPDICKRFMKDFEVESEKQGGRLAEVEKMANHNSDEIIKINGRLDKQERKQDQTLRKLEHVINTTDELSSKWDIERKNRESLTKSSLEMVVAFNANGQKFDEGIRKIDEVGEKLLKKLGEKS
jgi:hypothetical protein